MIVVLYFKNWAKFVKLIKIVFFSLKHKKTESLNLLINVFQDIKMVGSTIKIVMELLLSTNKFIKVKQK